MPAFAAPVTFGVLMIWLSCIVTAAALLVAMLVCWRVCEQKAENNAWQELAGTLSGASETFNPAMVAGLPEPARRYFNFTIQPGTKLVHAVEINMTGELSLGTAEAPAYRPMSAREILCPPGGFVWSLRCGAISGTEGILYGRSWTRFWLLRLLPVARSGGPDHLRSAFGRLVAESAFWAPANLLPGAGVTWEALGVDSARVTLLAGPLQQSVEIHVDAEGAPECVIFQRWSNANCDQAYRLQPFGGELSGFQQFDGYRLPTRVIAGNHYGTPDYFPFFKVTVTDVRFP